MLSELHFPSGKITEGVEIAEGDLDDLVLHVTVAPEPLVRQNREIIILIPHYRVYFIISLGRRSDIQTW